MNYLPFTYYIKLSMLPINIAEDIFVGPVPKLVVFDLDETVWPNHCDRDTKSPYTVDSENILDRYGRIANCFPIIPLIISTLVNRDILVAFATRNPARDEIIARLKSLVFDTKNGERNLWSILPNENYLQAYSSHGGTAKTKHFNALTKVTGVPFNEMLFFDDDSYNVTYSEFLGVTGMLVPKNIGFTLNLFIQGMSTYQVKALKCTCSSPESTISVGTVETETVETSAKKQKTKEEN